MKFEYLLYLIFFTIIAYTEYKNEYVENVLGHFSLYFFLYLYIIIFLYVIE